MPDPKREQLNLQELKVQIERLQGTIVRESTLGENDERRVLFVQGLGMLRDAIRNGGYVGTPFANVDVSEWLGYDIPTRDEIVARLKEARTTQEAITLMRQEITTQLEQSRQWQQESWERVIAGHPLTPDESDPMIVHRWQFQKSRDFDRYMQLQGFDSGLQSLGYVCDEGELRQMDSLNAEALVYKLDHSMDRRTYEQNAYRNIISGRI